jgi:hypothetical protein
MMQLQGDIEEARVHYRRNALKTKTDVDQLENWRQRIAHASKELDARRKELGKPLQQQIDDINARFFKVTRSANDCATWMGTLRDGWDREERARKEAEARAAAQAELESRRAAAEAENERIEAERAKLMDEHPTLYHSSPEPERVPVPEEAEPVIVVPKTLYGTGPRRASAKAATPTAVIFDLEAVALHFVKTKNPDIIALLQRLANAAARSKARTTIPGCRMSWESNGPTQEASDAPLTGRTETRERRRPSEA